MMGRLERFSSGQGSPVFQGPLATQREFFSESPHPPVHESRSSYLRGFSSRGESAAMAQTRLESAFESGAVRFNVAESDFLVLKNEGIGCFEDLFYRLPTREDLEKFLEEVVNKKGGYRDSAGIPHVYDKAGSPWSSWRRSDDAACLRKLWSFGSTLCKSELEDLTSGVGTGDKIKFTLAAAAELENKAVLKGMTQPTSDVERPSLWTLQRLANNHSLSGKHLHMEWESFVSMEQEDRARRSGSLLKERPAVFVVGGKHLEVRDQEIELDGIQTISGLVTLREVLELRARSFAMLELAPFSLMSAFHERLFSLLRQRTAEGMRAPTINEVRKFDREIMRQALRWKSEKQGEIADCLSFYLNSPGISLWRLLEPVPEQLPDQGLDKKSDSKKGEDPRGVKRQLEMDSEKKGEQPGKKGSEKSKKKCWICNKVHEPLCPLPPGYRKNLKAEKQAKAKAKSEAKKQS